VAGSGNFYCPARLINLSIEEFLVVRSCVSAAAAAAAAAGFIRCISLHYNRDKEYYKVVYLFFIY